MIMARKQHHPALDQRGNEPAAAPVDAAGRMAERLEAELAAQLSSPLVPALYVVATPIGNMADVTLRALAVIARADAVFCEDTRHTLKLLNRYGVARTLEAYHEHNAERIRPRILDGLAQGRKVALLSDAGTPLVSDPGFKVVRAAQERGHRVIAIPGASAVLAGLVSAGLPTDRFSFEGFLPPRRAARRARLRELAAADATLVFFEAPSRIGECLDDMAAVLGARPAALARELTKVHEEVRRDTLAGLAAWAAANAARGEFVIVVGAQEQASEQSVADEEIASRLAAALEGASVRDASKLVADALGVPKARVYDLALRLRRGGI